MWTKLITISENSITQLIAINEDSTINVTTISKSWAIKEVGSDGNIFDDIKIVNVNDIWSIKISKLTQSKNLL